LQFLTIYRVLRSITKYYEVLLAKKRPGGNNPPSPDSWAHYWL